jgi:general secretion pathway protein A
MYESHFGFSGSPFQLNPDPAFYFESRGHSNALAYLKFGAHQGEGFIVVTGEIGAGKTTLVRTLLEGLDPEQVVAAQVVSTQLESGELLQAILMAFGIASSSNSKAHLIGSLEAFLTSLAAKGRRALLIIDEAQNLKHEAVEELRMLSNFQLGKYGLLQSFLVGQPELRQLLQSKSMEQLRQRVIASCHLGPLAPAETRAYIEHRLRVVGWSGRPQFEPDAFERIHHWTGGVPRKTNRLCNRLLLGAFLSNDETITALMVDRTAGELRSEIGELTEIPEAPEPYSQAEERVEQPVPKKVPESPPAPVKHSVDATASLPATTDNVAMHDGRAKVRLVQGPATSAATAELPRSGAPLATGRNEGSVATNRVERVVADAAAVVRAESPASLTVVPPLKSVAAVAKLPVQASEGESVAVAAVTVKRVTHRNSRLHRPLVCLVDTRSDFLKAGILAEEFLKFPRLPHVIAVQPGLASWSLSSADADTLPMPFVSLHVDGKSGSFADEARQTLQGFEEILDEFDPTAVLAMGTGDATLACCLLARKRGFPLIRVAGGQRLNQAKAGAELNGALIDKLANALYVNRMESYYTLYQEGIKSDRVLCVGNLIGDVLKNAQHVASSSGTSQAVPQLAPGAAGSREGFALVTMGECGHASDALSHTVAALCAIGAVLPLVWTVNDSLLKRIQAQDGSAARLASARVTLLPDSGYLQQVGLLMKAKCLVGGADGVLFEEAASLRIPAVMLTEGAPAHGEAPDAAISIASPDQAASAVRRRLSEPPATDSPAYWDTGTASRIANHLLLWLPDASRKIGAQG